MTVPRWTPAEAPSKKEELILKRCTRHRRLFGFLRRHRHELFDEGFQKELASMYRATGSGKSPLPPAQLAMATLLQAYSGASDAEAVELSMMDMRWQMVLGELGAEKPIFSQGALHDFRARMIKHDMDRRLLERTVELAKKTNAFDWKKLPEDLRLAVDSRPLETAGRVEDSINLLGRAARKLLCASAKVLDTKPALLAQEIGTPLFVQRSIKSGLDVNWNDRAQRVDALGELLQQVDALVRWVHQEFGDKVGEEIVECLRTIEQLREQDLEPDPPDGVPRIRHGVAKDRRPSIEDGEARHGRKSKSKTFTGYKSHLGVDLRTRLVVAVAVEPANAPERDALASLLEHAEALVGKLTELHVDRGYLSAPAVDGIEAAPDQTVISKPHTPRLTPLIFSKDQFKVDFDEMTVTCPEGQSASYESLPATVAFPAASCGSCRVRDFCTHAREGHGRTIRLGRNEPMQQRLRVLSATADGRDRLRERVAVEHRLAHHAQKQGRRARYRGRRANLYDSRRHSALLNFEIIDLALREAA